MIHSLLVCGFFLFKKEVGGNLGTGLAGCIVEYSGLLIMVVGAKGRGDLDQGLHSAECNLTMLVRSIEGKEMRNRCPKDCSGFGTTRDIVGFALSANRIRNRSKVIIPQPHSKI